MVSGDDDSEGVYFKNNVGGGGGARKVKCHAVIAVVVRRDLMCSWLLLAAELHLTASDEVTRY